VDRIRHCPTTQHLILPSVGPSRGQTLSVPSSPPADTDISTCRAHLAHHLKNTLCGHIVDWRDEDLSGSPLPPALVVYFPMLPPSTLTGLAPCADLSSTDELKWFVLRSGPTYLQVRDLHSCIVPIVSRIPLDQTLTCCINAAMLQRPHLSLLVPYDGSVDRYGSSSGRSDGLVLYRIHLTVSCRSQPQPEGNLDITVSHNRKLLGQYHGGLVRQLPDTMHEYCHARECLSAMVLFLQSGVPCLSTGALRLRPTTMASILRYLQTDFCRTLLWECTPDWVNFRLLDICASQDHTYSTAVFTSKQLRDAVSALPRSLSIVYHTPSSNH
jgi:hypothetical protein